MLYLQTVVTTLALLVGAALLLSWLNGVTIQHLVNRRGKSSSELWLTKPGLWLHEFSHAALGRLFGMRIADFSVHDGPQAQSAGHVTLRVRKGSLWQHLGLFFAGGAPLWVSGALELISARYVFWPQVPLPAIVLTQPTGDWRWALGWLVMVCLINLGASLSRADVKMLLRGLPLMVVVLTLVAALGLIWPGVWAQWLVVNRLLLGLVLALVAISGATFALSHLM